MIILLAAERHRRKTGDWPTSIAAIDRSLLPTEPLDPCSGKSFRIERRDGQLIIYSIGPNHKDEHGSFEPKEYVKGIQDDCRAVGWDVHCAPASRGRVSRAQVPANPR